MVDGRDNDGYDDYITLTDYADELEKLGNIYENLELIEEFELNENVDG